jgi:YD repeat-containing protein
VYREVKWPVVGPPTVTFHDSDRRIIRTSSTVGSGKIVHEDVVFDARGRVLKKSLPFFDGVQPVWTAFAYDEQDRLTLTTRPDGSTERFVFDGLSTCHLNELNQQTCRHADALGRVRSVVDNLGKPISYSFESNGKLVSLQTADSVTRFVNDLQGNTVLVRDPDRGTLRSVFNALGLRVSFTNGNGQPTTRSYDLEDRVVSEASPEGDATWLYDAGAYALGKLSSLTMAFADPAVLALYQTNYSYDRFGR